MVLAGAQAPEALRVTVSNAGAASDPLDLTTVTAAELSVQRPDGQRVTWEATIASASATELVLEHVFDAIDVDARGQYRITIALTVPGGVRRAGPTVLQVVPA